eukprot:CAMPEP_0206526876 /NCGR_PEP_ID=MMETSP0325_2-20121206/1002_1 /ASSEMBLY_ACC=CAM_ASM_000347 /TAXON_ID=2866 /ORGANISM="Crypthecodinium cohnii, Strain Seligo" /LENGTH=414 /DNA_ID=CAMNT_0054022155 /DNA_START=274 /DNA_END=1515 /DNA_ORIENTATION=-
MVGSLDFFRDLASSTIEAGGMHGPGGRPSPQRPSAGSPTSPLALFLRGLGGAPEAGGLEERLRFSWFPGLDVQWSSLVKGLLLDTPVALAQGNHEGPRPMRSDGSTGRRDYLLLFQVSLEQWLPGKTSQNTAGVENYVLDTELGSRDEAASLDPSTIRSWELRQYWRLADDILRAGITVVACQKLVDPWLLDYLLKRGVSVLSRVSIRHFDHLQKMSGAVAITSLSALPDDLLSVCGQIGPLEVRSVCQHSYTIVRHVEVGEGEDAEDPRPTSRPVRMTTLLIGAPDDVAISELKRCLPQAVRALQDAASNGTAFQGGGRFEVEVGEALVDRALATFRESVGSEAATSAAAKAVGECLLEVASCLMPDTSSQQHRRHPEGWSKASSISQLRAALRDSSPAEQDSVLDAAGSKVA